MESLAGRLSTRFLLVTVLPNVLLIGYLLFLTAAGAPLCSPSLENAVQKLDDMSARELLVLGLIVLAVSVVTHPLQVPLVQFLEGYWARTSLGRLAAARAVGRFKREMRYIRRTLNDAGSAGWAARQRVDDAAYRQHWYPNSEELLLPTRLGNVLRAGEDRAGSRYGLDLTEALPRMFPVMSPESLREIDDRRNQLDLSTRLCVVAGLASVSGLALLVPTGEWLALPLLTFLVCWAAYQAAIAAAKGYCTALAAAVDLHHLDLFGALRLDPPANLKAELEFTPKLQLMFRGDELSTSEQQQWAYIHRDGTDVSSASGPGRQ